MKKSEYLELEETEAISALLVERWRVGFNPDSQLIGFRFWEKEKVHCFAFAVENIPQLVEELLKGRIYCLENVN